MSLQSPANKDTLQKAFYLGEKRLLTLLPILFVLCLFTSMDTMAWGSLQTTIQTELDGNPFLKEAKIKLRVIDEKNGYVTIEMAEGERALREGISKGFDINDSNDSLTRGHYCYKCSESNLNILKKSINVIRQMQGVKEVLLKAAVNTPLDQADEKFSQASSLYEKKKYEEAISLVRPYAELGHVPSQRVLGMAYQRGTGVEKDFDKAVMWLLKAAEQGDSLAQLALGTMYATGEGIAKDYGKALLWLEKSANQGDTVAQSRLGILYINGEGVSKDYDKSIFWWKKSADSGNQPSANNLAWLYASSTRYHDGELAVKYAQKAVNSNEKIVPEYNLRSTLAGSLARNNQFGEAVKNQEKAIRLLEADTSISREKKEKILNVFRDHLLLYKDGKPYTQKEESE